MKHADFVVNYAQVKEDPTLFHWKVGASVKGGQSIARVSWTAMLHFETYRLGTTQLVVWLRGKRRPAALLNPTGYLLDLRFVY